MDDTTEPAALLIPVIGTYANVAELARVLDSCFVVHQFPSATDLLVLLDDDDELAVPALVVNSDDVDAAAALDQLGGDHRLESTASIVLTSERECEGLGESISRGQLQAVAHLPIGVGQMGALINSVSHSWMVAHDREPCGDSRTRAYLDDVALDLMGDSSADDDQLTEQLVRAVDRAIGPMPRLSLPAGVRLTRQGEQAEGIFLLLSGEVALTRATPSEVLLMHRRSTGRVIGLLSLVGADNSYFTATTTTPAEVILLGMEQLRLALQRDPHLLAPLTVIAIRSLSQRLVRSEELQIERNELNWQIERERKRLRVALEKLKKARMELISQTKFAMLGELSAGIAHELNNPVAALTAAAEHIAGDIDVILTSHPAQELLAEGAHEGLNHGALSTAEERELRRQIEDIIGDPEMAFRLVAAGITDPRIVSSVSEKELELIEAAANIGTASRNIRTASARIAKLVASLRAYARPENENPQETDVRQTLDETLSLLSHRLRDVEVTKNYEPIPLIQAQPSQLGQVWTNLLVNAADAMEDGGEVEINVSAPEPDWVQVEIVDNGPGIPPKNFDKIFDPRFTTKQGTVRYGLGLGLSLTRQLVENHGGAISVDSQPGRTIFTVGLPIEGPPQEDE